MGTTIPLPAIDLSPQTVKTTLIRLTTATQAIRQDLWEKDRLKGRDTLNGYREKLYGVKD